MMIAASLRRLRPLTSAIRSHLSSLPEHNVVAMPALSPTMSSGTIGKWLMKEGDKVNAGDSMADIETDKASMAFEAQDEFYIAKIVVQEGTEVDVGVPIMITVEDQSDIAAFANYEAPVNTGASSSSPSSSSSPLQNSAPPATEVKVSSTPVSAPTAPTVSQPIQSVVTAPVIAANAVLRVNTMKPRFQSPLADKISTSQQRYIERFGRTGHRPLVVSGQ